MFRGKNTPGVALAALAAVLLCPAAGQASFPGANGKIAFIGGHLSTINPDGSGESTVDIGGCGGIYPAWSPDGSKLAFGGCAAGTIAVANADGSGVHVVASPECYQCYKEVPSWSPDGTRILYTYIRSYNNGEIVYYDLWIVNADGSGDAALTTDHGSAWGEWSPDGTKIAFGGAAGLYTIRPDGSGRAQIPNTLQQDNAQPSWSPDSRKLAFARYDGGGAYSIYRINIDGTGLQQLTTTVTALNPSWSPDGEKIAFQTDISNPYGHHLTTMNADGTNQTTIPTTGDATFPDWQPIPQTYVRPRGATPLRVSLVPASNQCTSPNNTHGAPLSFSSCSPPVQASPNVTVGTPDANGSNANSTGYVRLDAVAGDVKLAASITDVRCYHNSSTSFCADPNFQPANDYSGELKAMLNIRITDRNNTPNPGAPGPGTAQDTTIPFTIPCTATGPSNFIGSTCAVSTTVNSLTPGAVVAGMRTIWQLDKVDVYDGGSDGVASTTPNRLFATQGVFIP